MWEVERILRAGLSVQKVILVFLIRHIKTLVVLPLVQLIRSSKISLRVAILRSKTLLCLNALT